MNDEIKEILDYLTKFINDKEEITKYGCEISVKQAKQLLDYITNLQHTKEYLGEVLYEKDKELEKLKTKTKEQSLLLIDYQDMEQKLEDYKSRCEKALLIIEKQKKKMYKSRNKIAIFILIKLDNILNGKE